ncbi:copper homeostasis protein CutC [Cohnella suwonensis]|uniref:PF03932 family protein CutC n=1 Tax=Cohnella suwonensis TaxID=696072 RepID=A0ABW0M0G8_9BACL
MLLEVIAINLADVKAANEYGADRIELVTGIAEGGLTPSIGLVEAAVAASRIPVNVMVRPHSQSFRYDEDDIAVMLRDIEAIGSAGAAGIVFGGLDAAGGVDVPLLKKVLAAADAAGLDVTFHRAFDEIDDQVDALRTLASYPGIHRILTSGGRQPAPQALPRLRELQEAARHTSIRILAGHGLDADTLGLVLRETGVPEVHFGSAVREDGSFANPISASRVRRIKEILNLHSENGMK